MTNQNNKKANSDLSYLLIAAGVFTVALLIAEFAYKNFEALMASWVAWPFIGLQVIMIVLWAICIIKIEDPNADKYRRWLFVAVIAALLIMMAHRAGWVDKRMFDEDVKQEQHDS